MWYASLRTLDSGSESDETRLDFRENGVCFIRDKGNVPNSKGRSAGGGVT
jgi:hypothetical protein